RKSLNTLIEDYYPPIIDEKTYYLSQQRKFERSKPEAAGRKTEYPNPLNQIAKCKKCGSSMYYENKSQNLKYLTCREFKKKNCTNKPIRMELIYRFIYEVFNSPMYHQQHAKLVDKSKQKDVNKLTELEGRYEVERKAYEELLEAFSSFSDPIALKELQRRSALITGLYKQIEEAKAKKTVEQARTAHINFTEALKLTTKALYSPLVEERGEELSPDELFTTRVRLNRILKQAFNHLSIFHCNESKRITIETEITEDYPIDLRYETNQKAIKEPMKNRIWSVY
ncbi:zinc ribbon domain-containing protein, partial [Vibrio parahaemolyticus]